MLPFVFKKREELKAVVDYLGSRITGTEFVDVLNESVRIGNRTGRIRIVHIPYTRRSGQALRREEMRENVVRFLLKKRLVSTGVIDEIKEFGLRSEAANLESPRSFEKRCERMGKQAVNY